eukprot:tig00000663_g2986.t1
MSTVPFRAGAACGGGGGGCGGGGNDAGAAYAGRCSDASGGSCGDAAAVPSSLEQLPAELCRQILACIDPFELLTTTSLVCRAWRRLVYAADWQTLSFRGRPFPFSFLRCALGRLDAGSVRRLDLTACCAPFGEEDARAIVSLAPSVEEVVFPLQPVGLEVARAHRCAPDAVCAPVRPEKAAAEEFAAAVRALLRGWPRIRSLRFGRLPRCAEELVPGDGPLVGGRSLPVPGSRPCSARRARSAGQPAGAGLGRRRVPAPARALRAALPVPEGHRAWFHGGGCLGEEGRREGMALEGAGEAAAAAACVPCEWPTERLAFAVLELRAALPRPCLLTALVVNALVNERELCELVRRLPLLRVLHAPVHVSSTARGDDGVLLCGQLALTNPALTELSLDGAVQDHAVREIVQLRRLRRLHVHQSHFSAHSLRRLAAMPAMQHLLVRSSCPGPRPPPRLRPRRPAPAPEPLLGGGAAGRGRLGGPVRIEACEALRSLWLLLPSPDGTLVRDCPRLEALAVVATGPGARGRVQVANCPALREARLAPAGALRLEGGPAGGAPAPAPPRAPPLP